MAHFCSNKALRRVLSCTDLPDLLLVTNLIGTSFVYGIGPVKQIKLRKIAIIFLSISLNMCFWCSKEPSHRDGSFEYPQHMFWLRNKKNDFQSRTLIWGPYVGLDTRKQVFGILQPDHDQTSLLSYKD